MNFQKGRVARAWSAAAAAVLLCMLSSAGYAEAGRVEVSPGTLNFGQLRGRRKQHDPNGDGHKRQPGKRHD
jgi:hypothetical protein